MYYFKKIGKEVSAVHFSIKIQSSQYEDQYYSIEHQSFVCEYRYSTLKFLYHSDPVIAVIV